MMHTILETRKKKAITRPVKLLFKLLLPAKLNSTVTLNYSKVLVPYPISLASLPAQLTTHAQSTIMGCGSSKAPERITSGKGIFRDTFCDEEREKDFVNIYEYSCRFIICSLNPLTQLLLSSY